VTTSFWWYLKNGDIFSKIKTFLNFWVIILVNKVHKVMCKNLKYVNNYLLHIELLILSR
jgi:hypothetical protein